MTHTPRKIYYDTNLHVIFSITLMAVLGVASISPAFPAIIREFDISAREVGLLITVFTFPGIILTLVLGIVADRFGRKKILIPSLILFGLAGGACAFTRDFNVLLILRFLQGIGAASLGSLNITLIGDIYSGKDRTSAMGYNAGVLSMGTASYPVIGGALAALNWHYVFLLPLAAIPVGIFAFYFLKNPEPRNEQDFSEYLKMAWGSIKNFKVIGLFIASIVTFIILYGPYLTFFPLLIGHSFGRSSLVIGLVMSGMSLTTALVSSQLGRLSKIVPEQTLLKTAFILYAISLAAVPYIPNVYALLVPTMLFGVAQGINIPSAQTLLTSLAPMEYRGAFMSVNGMVLRFGQTLGPLLAGIIFSQWGMDGAFFGGAFLSLLMFVTALFMIK